MDIEGVRSRNLVAGVIGGRSEEEVEKVKNYEAVMTFNVNDAAGNVRWRRADVANTIGCRQMFSSIIDIEGIAGGGSTSQP